MSQQPPPPGWGQPPQQPEQPVAPPPQGPPQPGPYGAQPGPQGPPQPWTPPAGWSPQQPPPWPGAPVAPQQPPGAWPGGSGQQAGWPAPQQQAPWPGSQPPPGAWGAPTAAGQGWGGQPAQPWGPPPQAPKPGIVPLRPLGVGELLDGALGLIRSNPRTVLGLAAAISAVSALIQTVGVWIGLSALGATSVSLTGSGTLSTDLTALTASSAAQLVPALIAGFLQVLASGLFIVLVGAAVLGRRLDAGQTWAELRPRLLALIAVSLLVFLGVLAVIAVLVGGVIGLVAAFGEWAALPGVLLVLAGGVAAVYAYVRLALASPALVMEGLGPMASLRRSWRLVRGSWWRVAGILLLAAIITNLLTTIVSVPLSLVAAVVTGVSESMLPTVLAAGLATLLAGIVTLPFTAAVTGLLYTDLRMRREALDIELVSAGVDPQADPLAAYRRGR